MDTKKFLSNILRALENFVDLYEKDCKEQAFVQLGVTMADIRRFTEELCCDDCDCDDDEEETQEEIDAYFGRNKNYDEQMMEMGKTLIEIIQKNYGSKEK